MSAVKIKFVLYGGIITQDQRDWFLWWIQQIEIESTRRDKNCTELSTTGKWETRCYWYSPINRTFLEVIARHISQGA